MCDVKLSQERVEGQFKQEAAPLNAQGRAGAGCVGGRSVGGVWPTHSPGPGSCVTLQPQPGHNLSAVLSTWLPVPPHSWWALKVSVPLVPRPPVHIHSTGCRLPAPCLHSGGPSMVSPELMCQRGSSKTSKLLFDAMGRTLPSLLRSEPLPGSLSFLRDTPSG